MISVFLKTFSWKKWIEWRKAEGGEGPSNLELKYDPPYFPSAGLFPPLIITPPQRNYFNSATKLVVFYILNYIFSCLWDGVFRSTKKHPGGSSPRTLTSCISQTSKTEMGGLAHFLALILYQRIFNELQSISLFRRCMIWLLLPPHSSLLPSVSWTHRKTGKETTCWR
jgi:hypothetical protein